MRSIVRVSAAAILLVTSPFGTGGEEITREEDEKVDVPAERPFDAVNIFGDLRRLEHLPDTHENKLWWERMARGEVGKDRFLILCALKDGNWKRLADIRDYVESQARENFHLVQLHKMLVLMSGRPNFPYAGRTTKKLKTGEGWLEKNREADFGGLDSQWRIAPSVLPLLYFLLMGCPDDTRCR